MIALFALAGLLALAGCGGSSSNSGSNANAQYKLAQPVVIATAPGSIGGTIFTMAANSNDPTATVLIDEPVNAVVTLTGTTASGTAITPLQTTSTYRGGYSFPSVGAGTYTVTATASSPNNGNAAVSGSVSGVVVQGNIPTLMVNLLLGVSGNLYTFTGTITQDGKAAGGATVSVDVTAHTPPTASGDPTSTTDLASIIISTTANPDGTYQIIVPAGGTDYYIASHSTTSMVAQTADLNGSNLPSTTTPNVENLTLTDATTPVFANLSLDIVSTTLPAPTSQASDQALLSKIAYARLRNAPQAYQTRLQQFRTGKRTTRVISGVVENDLYWSLSAANATQSYVDVGVRGFNVYRATAPTAPFVLSGTLRDPYLLFFFDNDPALCTLPQYYYTVTSYAANGQESSPATAVEGQPLPQISVQGPAAGGTVSLSSGAFTWTAVPGALSYVVMKYAVNPTFNDTPVGSLTIHTATDTREALSVSGLTTGTYWWSIQAFNTTDPTLATAASYSAYQQVVVTN